jgi:hypothetical protein
MDIYSFDEAYLQRLKDSDTATEMHFISYFSHLLRIKLRARVITRSGLDSVSQETLTRALNAVKNGDVRHPESLGSFVNSVCDQVLRTHYFQSTNTSSVDLLDSIGGSKVDLEGQLQLFEHKAAIERTLTQLLMIGARMKWLGSMA